MTFAEDDGEQAGTDTTDKLGAEKIFPLLTEPEIGLALFTLDASGRIDSWTPGARAVFGWSGKEIIGESFEVMFTPEDLAAGAPAEELAMASRLGQAPDVRWHVRKGGGRVYVRGTTQRLLDAAGRVSGFLKAGRDNTQHRLDQEALVEQERDNARLAERTLMAQELHDTLAQGFTGISLQLELAEQALREASPRISSALHHLSRALSFARQCQQESRHTIRALRSPLIEDLSLNHALKRLVVQLEGNASITLTCAGPPLHLPSPLMLSLVSFMVGALAYELLGHAAATAVLAMSTLSIAVYLVGMLAFFLVALLRQGQGPLVALKAYLVHLGLLWEASVCWCELFVQSDKSFVRTDKFLRAPKWLALLGTMAAALASGVAGLGVVWSGGSVVLGLVFGLVALLVLGRAFLRWNLHQIRSRTA